MLNDSRRAPATPAPSALAPAGALPDRADFLASIVRCAMDAIITVDESQRIVLFNEAAERIFGVPADEAIGTPLDRFIPERHRHAHARHVQGFGKTGVTMRTMGRLGTLSGVRAGGEEFPIEASISQAVIGGARFYTVILRDVTEQHKLRAQLLQAQKMEGVGQFVGGVAHDFNNLIMAVMNNLTLASRRLDDSHPASAPLSHAREASSRAVELTRQLLAFSRKQTVKPRILNPRDLIVGMEDMLRRMLGQAVELRSSLADDTWDVCIDGGQFGQVLMNLACNARDAMPDGGAITIETENVTLDEADCRAAVGGPGRPGPHVRIAVSDTGGGIPAEIINQIFDPFFTTKPPGVGTGLGLAMCHGIVTQAGGHITVHSEPGHGACIAVLLPRAGEAKPAREPARGTILLVHASQLARHLLAETLRAEGYATIVASSGSLALQLAAAHRDRIDLLITSAILPDMAAHRVVEAVRSARGEAPVVWVTPGPDETSGVLPPAPPAAAVLPGPPGVDALLSAVRRAFEAAP